MAVAGGVAVEFGLPEFGVVLGERVITFWAAVPVAAVDEDGEFAAATGTAARNVTTRYPKTTPNSG